MSEPISNLHDAARAWMRTQSPFAQHADDCYLAISLEMELQGDWRGAMKLVDIRIVALSERPVDCGAATCVAIRYGEFLAASEDWSAVVHSLREDGEQSCESPTGWSFRLVEACCCVPSEISVSDVCDPPRSA